MPDNSFISGIIPDCHYRFVIACNSALCNEIMHLQETDAACAALAGELLLGAFFLCSHSAKMNDESIGIHLERNQSPERIIAQASASGRMRVSIAEHELAQSSGGLLPPGSILKVTRWRESKKLSFTSLIEVVPGDFAASLDHFIGQSDQMISFTKIQSRPRMAGYFFQALPGAEQKHHRIIGEFVDMTDPLGLLESVNQQTEVRSFSGKLSFVALSAGYFQLACDCNAGKIHDLVKLLGRDESEKLLTERGLIEIKCEFCKKKYRLNAEEVGRLFDAG
jgi:redox-regulated HSP33 family molecular chaperone